MKISKILVLFAVLFSLSSCEKSAFKQFDEFDENRWYQNDVRQYDFVIPESGNYDLKINFSSAYGSPFAAIPLKVTIVFPDKTTTVDDVSLKLLDESGTVLSDCSGDFCDLEQVVFSNKKFDAGSYKISVANEFDHEFLPNVLGVGIRLVAVKK